MRRLRAKPQQATHRTAIIPAPTGGINETKTVYDLAPNECVYGKGFIATAGGISPGFGSTVWHTAGSYSDGETSGLSAHAFHGSTSSGDRLWVFTSKSIFDATTSQAALPLDYTFPVALGGGYAYGTSYVTSGGHFYLVADSANGYLLYTETGDTWTRVASGAGAGEISGADPNDFRFVTVWKNRVWFVEKDCARAWYLPVGQVTGTVTSFEFGNKFPHGGTLVGLWNYTRDGGSGPDDFLIAVSTSGDVLVYQGNDPDTAGDFQCVGVFNVGGVPTLSRDIAESLGGELLLMTARGILPVSRLFAGAPPTPEQFLTYKIGPTFTTVFAASSASRFIGMRVHPRENSLWVHFFSTSWRMSLSTGAWTRHEGSVVGGTAGVVWRGNFYFFAGTTNNGIRKSTPGNFGVNAFTASAGTSPEIGLVTAPFGVERPTNKTVIQARALWGGTGDTDPTEFFNVTYAPENCGTLAVATPTNAGTWKGPRLDTTANAPSSGTAIALLYGALAVDTQMLSRFEVLYREGGLW